MRRSLLVLAFAVLSPAAAAQVNFPPPPAPAGNPATANKVLLGMALFFEEQLSSTGTVACATCHDFGHGGADPRTAVAVHPGADGLLATADDVRGSPGVAAFAGGSPAGSQHYGFGPQVTGRRAPTVVNCGYHPSLFYDGRAATGTFADPLTNQTLLTGPVALENLVLGPPLNPVEMGHPGRTWPDVVQKLAAATPLVAATELPWPLEYFVRGRGYPALFQQVFGSPGVTPARIAMAIAAYLRTLNSDDSPWDRHLAGTYTLSPVEQAGLVLFRTPRSGAVACNACHGDFEARVRLEGPIVGAVPVLFNGYYGSVSGARLLFHNIGLRPSSEDPGRSAVTNASADLGRFRTASLRNVEHTAPYFHNGSAATLLDAIDFYSRGGDFHQHQAPGLLPRNYTVAEKDALVAILRTLTDPRLAAGVWPFERPVLGAANGRLCESVSPSQRSRVGRPLVAAAPVAPRLGEAAFCITLQGAAPGSFELLMWDTDSRRADPTLWGIALALSANWTPIGIGFAQHLASMPGDGVAIARAPLPAAPALRGLVLYAQWLSFDGSGVQGFSVSNALRIEVR